MEKPLHLAMSKTGDDPAGPPADEHCGNGRDSSKLTRLGLPEPIGWKEGLRAGWKAEPALQFYGREVLLGVIICMAQIPESIAFAYLARVRAPVALHAAWVIGVVCAILGGRPGMINGATGAFAAIVATFLAEPDRPGGNGLGVELLFPSVIIAGVFMLGAWAMRLDRFISLLPLPVMIGFCNGLAIVIGRAQLHPYNAPVCGAISANASSGSAAHRLLSASGPCTESGFKEGPELWFMLLIMMSAMLIMEFVPKMQKPKEPEKKPMPLRIAAYITMVLLELPSSMLAIIVSITLEFALIRPLGVPRHLTSLPAETAPTSHPHLQIGRSDLVAGFRTDTIGDKERFTADDALPKPFFIDNRYDMSKYGEDGAITQIITQGILLCAVGCIESLMTAEVVSSFTKTSHHSGLVVGAMGLGNILSGFFGGMGGNAMIGLSTIACLNGGRGRIAPLATAIGILICVSCAYHVLNFIPMAALAGIMIVVVLHTFKWSSLPMIAAALLSKQNRDALSRHLEMCSRFSLQRKVIRSDVIIMLVVSVLVVATNIVLAVGFGLGLSCGVYAWQSAEQLAVYSYSSYREGADGNKRLVKTYEVSGSLFFAATKSFSDYFTPEEDPEHVVCTFSGGGILFDYTMMDAMVALSAHYKAEGKRIEFHALRPASVKMLNKASHWTKEVVYVEHKFDEQDIQAMAGGGDHSMKANTKRRITGLYAPNWADTPGPGIYDIAPSAAADATAEAPSGSSV